MLVLNTYKEQNTPLLMDYNGDFYSIDFEIEPLTEVHRSCSASINGEFYIFGGLTQTRQISKIVNCSLARIGDLPYELAYPACGTYRFPEERSMMCFASGHSSSCVRFDQYLIKDGHIFVGDGCWRRHVTNIYIALKIRHISILNSIQVMTVVYPIHIPIQRFHILQQL